METDIKATLAVIISIFIGFSIGAAVMLGAKENKAYYQGLASGLASCHEKSLGNND